MQSLIIEILPRYFHVAYAVSVLNIIYTNQLRRNNRSNNRDYFDLSRVPFSLLRNEETIESGDSPTLPFSRGLN